MRILNLIYDDVNNPWLGGGGSVRTYEVYKRLAKKNEITVITGNYPGAKREEETEGILYRRVGSDKSYIISRLSYSLNVPKIIKKIDFDILIEDFSAFSPIFSPLYTQKPVIALIGNIYGIHTIKNYKLIGVLPFIFEKIGLKLYKNFIAVSPSIEKQLKTKVRKNYKMATIPYGVENSLFSLKQSEENYILFLGRIDFYQKGIDILLKAFSKVIEKSEKTNLIIAGGGKDAMKLQNYILKLNIKSNIKFVGRVHGQKKKDLLSNCLFVCIPSRFESWCIVAIESAACGKPVVATRIPGLWDAVKDKETGILVEPNNPKELSEAMIKLIEDANLRKKLGKNGKKWAKNFDWDNIAQMQERFYLECLNL